MPSSSTGKWVSRAAATGGGRAYRGKRPVNWYAGLAIILVLGLLSVGFARYEYSHPSSNSSSATHTWYAGLSFVRCGTVEPALPAQSSSGSGVSTPGSGVLTISVKDKSKATLSRFVDHYSGLALTSTKLKYPGAPALSKGDSCPKGSPDAGKKGRVVVVHWAGVGQPAGQKVSGDPGALPLTNGQLVTAAFVPVGAKVPKPPQSTISAVLSSLGGTPPTTTTTTAPGTTTTAPGATTTTSPPTTTTSLPPTTTSPPTTVKPKSPSTTSKK